MGSSIAQIAHHLIQEASIGFFHVEKKATPTSLFGVSIATLHRGECSICPLNNAPNLRHPKMEATGSESPLAYMLGEAPGENEDRRGEQFVGKAGKVLKVRLPEGVEKQLRWNNVIRTRPPDNRDPTAIEVECCRPSIIRDIERTKPKAIFGFGNVPLNWALGVNGITKWRGRRVPIKVGSHTCWFFPMLHPSFILRKRRFTPRDPLDFGSDDEVAFALDLKRAFQSIDNLSTPVVHTEAMAHANVEIVTGENGQADVDRVLDWFEYLHTQPSCGLDLETNGKRPYPTTLGATPKILTAALAAKRGALAFALRHRESQWTPGHLAQVEEAFIDFLYTYKGRKIVHHLAFEMEWLAYFYGTDVLRAGEWDCSMSEAFILDERTDKGAWGCLSLEFLCIQHFCLNIKKLSNIDRKKVDSEPLRSVLTYNAIDAKYHRYLHLTQMKLLKSEKLLGVYEHHLSRIPTVVGTQLKGIPIKQEVVQHFYDMYSTRLEATEAKLAVIPELAKFKRMKGYEFRPSAEKDVSFLFRKIVGIFDLEGTDEKLLAKIDHPVAGLIVEWRKSAKVLSTYVKPVMTNSPHLYGNRVHPIYSTCKTRTWRTSSEDINNQNWPKRNLETKDVRKQVSPKAHERVVAFDFAGIQARNVAMESKDAALVQAFWDRYDIHTDWMDRIIQLYPKWIKGGLKKLDDKPTKKMYRDLAKNQLVFPSFFGAQPPSISKYLGIPEEITQKLHGEFWERFPNIKDWHKRLLKDYHKLGYVTGLSGFRRRAPISQNELINAPIQADESIIVLDAMNRLSEMEDPRFQASMEIHDDLTFIWDKKEIDRNAEVVIGEMIKISFPWINVPLVVEMSIGEDWGSTKGAGEFSSDTWGTDSHVKHDPNNGSWADGTGWADDSDPGMENIRKPGRRLGRTK